MGQRFLVKARIKPGMKASLASRLKDGTLAQGEPHQDALLQALRRGHGDGDEAYFVVEAAGEAMPHQSDDLEAYFDILQVVPEDRVRETDQNVVDGLDPLPEWAGVD